MFDAKRSCSTPSFPHDADQVVMEVRKTPKKDSGAVLQALEAVRTQIMSESGLRPTRLVSGGAETLTVIRKWRLWCAGTWKPPYHST